MKTFTQIRKSSPTVPWIFLSVLLFQYTYGSSQTFVPTALKEDNEVIRGIAREVDPAGWIYFKNGANLREGELFDTYKQDMGLGQNDDMILVRTLTDEYGYTHNRYQQYYKGIRIEGAEYDEHLLECVVQWANGKLLEQPNGRDVSPALGETVALQFAMAYMSADTFSWEDQAWEADYRYTLEDSNATSFPTGELVLANVNLDKVVPENYILAWKFQILSVVPSKNLEIYVDAQTGAILSARDPSQHDGPADLLFNYGEQTIDTRWHWGPFPWNNYFHLRTNDSGRSVYTKRGTSIEKRRNFNRANEVWDLDDDWPMNDAEGTTVHWAISRAWDYFDQRHGRQGWRDDGGMIRIWSGSSEANAFFGRFNDLEWLEFGEFDQADLRQLTGNPALIFNGLIELASVDICGHEFAHGVTFHASGLGGVNEPGALNESFSDIFGFLIERFTFPNDFDWIVGEDALAGTPADIVQRSLIDPGAIPSIALPDRASIGLPNIFMGPRWYTGAFDAGGVHINCGPQNRWFNLLAVGGLENGINVQGIGIDNAARITYLSLITQIQNMSMYPDARAGAIASARIIFGDCSNELIQTTNAWAAVGVGAPFNGACLEVNGPFVMCIDRDAPVVFTATAPAGAVINWNVPANWVFNLTGPGNNTLILTDIGPPEPEDFDVHIVQATSSLGGQADFIVVHYCLDDQWLCGGSKDGETELTVVSNTNNIWQSKQTSSIENNATDSFILYPNPTDGVVHILSDGPVEHYSLFNPQGTLIGTDRIVVGSEIDLGKYEPGVYIIRVSTSVSVITKKVVKY